jgi:hypothetical protein
MMIAVIFQGVAATRESRSTKLEVPSLGALADDRKMWRFAP